MDDPEQLEAVSALKTLAKQAEDDLSGLKKEAEDQVRDFYRHNTLKNVDQRLL